MNPTMVPRTRRHEPSRIIEELPSAALVVDGEAVDRAARYSAPQELAAVVRHKVHGFEARVDRERAAHLGTCSLEPRAAFGLSLALGLEEIALDAAVDLGGAHG